MSSLVIKKNSTSLASTLLDSLLVYNKFSLVKIELIR